MNSLALDFSQQRWQLLLLSVWGSPYSGLPFSQYDRFPSLVCSPRSGLGGNICSTPWQQKQGHDLQMCWEASSTSSWGSQAFRLCGGGALPLFPLSDTGCKECPGLNGPCVKMWGGGQSPSTPLKAAPEQEAAPRPGCTHLQSSVHMEKGPQQTSPPPAPQPRSLHSTPYTVA